MSKKKQDENNNKPTLGTTDEVMSGLYNHFGDTATITPIDKKMLEAAKKNAKKAAANAKKAEANAKKNEAKKKKNVKTKNKKQPENNDVDMLEHAPDQVSELEFDNYFNTEVVGKIVETPTEQQTDYQDEIEVTQAFDVNTHSLGQYDLQNNDPYAYDPYMQETEAFEYALLEQGLDQQNAIPPYGEQPQGFEPLEKEQTENQSFIEKMKKVFSIKRLSFDLTSILSAVGIFLIVAAITTFAVLFSNEMRETVIDVGEAVSAMTNRTDIIKVDITDDSNADGVRVFMRASSAEEDLTITFIDSDGNQITGFPFSVDIVFKDQEKQNHVDEDMDGEIYIQEIESGSYSIQYVPPTAEATPTETTYLAPSPVSVNVAPKVEYVPIENVTIYESDSSTQEEDGGGSRGDGGETESVPVAPPSTETVNPFADTVEFVESSSEVKKITSEVITALNFTADLYTPPAPAETEPSVDPESDVIPEGQPAPISYTPQTLNNNTIKTETLSVAIKTFASSNNILRLSTTADSGVRYLKNADGTATDIEAIIDPVTGFLIGGQRNVNGTITSVEIFDTNTPRDILKDENGNYLYLVTKAEVKETVESEQTVYYGWQTFEDKKYFYDKTGVIVTGEQVIQGVKYQFDENGVMTSSATPTPTMPTDGSNIGIDISEFQEDIDWNAVKASGINYAILRVGFRGYGSGRIVQDVEFHNHYVGAKAAGLKVGVYFFSCALTTQEAVEEASATLDMIRGYDIDYPIAIDIEMSEGYTSRANDWNYMSSNERTKIAIAFAETIKSAGYSPMIYSFKSWFEDGLYASELEQYIIWLAHVGVSETSYARRYDIWQYTWVGDVPGISGDVDLNRSYLGY